MAERSAPSVLLGLPREVAGVVRRNLWAAAVPAAVLGAGADGLLLVAHHVEAQIALALLVAVGFELYVAYAELIVGADGAAAPRPRVRSLLRRALPLTPGLALASVAAVTLPLAAAGLLVLPGLWLLTRWSLFAPAVVHEHLGPVAAIHRSTALVRGVFWAVAGSVTVSVLLEHAVIHGTVHEAEPATGSRAAGLAIAALATMIVSPPAAFTVSLVYERLTTRRPDARAGLPPEAGGPPSRVRPVGAGSGR